MSDAPTGISLIATGLVAEIVTPIDLFKSCTPFSSGEFLRCVTAARFRSTASLVALRAVGPLLASARLGGSAAEEFSENWKFLRFLHDCVTIRAQHSEALARPVL